MENKLFCIQAEIQEMLKMLPDGLSDEVNKISIIDGRKSLAELQIESHAKRIEAKKGPINIKNDGQYNQSFLPKFVFV